MRPPAQPSERTLTNPVAGVMLGDPFVLRFRGRFYLYGTNDGLALADGREIPVYRSDDLLNWELLGGALEPTDPTSDHWAPEVLAWNGRFFMVVSFGDVERRGHALWVAVADRPEGPFQLRSRISQPDERFSIDGAWLLDEDGRLYLFRCLDFVEEADPPSGTGIVVQEMRDPFTPIGPPQTVLRAQAPWQLFLANRTMPLYGGRTFAEWTTIEGPAPVHRAGRYFCGYSGGNYTGAYGTGEASAESPLGPYQDEQALSGPIFGTVPGLVEGPGHFSVVRPDLVHDWIALHGRTPGESVRRLWLCPAQWDATGVTVGPLTTEAQPAPPLPDFQSRFSAGGELVEGRWRTRDGQADTLDEGLVPSSTSGVRLLCEAVSLAGDWVVEWTFRGLGPESGEVGVEFGAGANAAGVRVDLARARCEATAADGTRSAADWPILGDEPFQPEGWHAVEVRAKGGQAEVRCDGVRRLPAFRLSDGSSALLLRASGRVVIDSVSITLVR